MVDILISYAIKHVMHKSNAHLHEPLFLGFTLLITHAACQALLDTAVHAISLSCLCLPEGSTLEGSALECSNHLPFLGRHVHDPDVVRYCGVHLVCANAFGGTQRLEHPCPVSSDTEDAISSREYDLPLFARETQTDQANDQILLSPQTPFITTKPWSRLLPTVSWKKA